MRKKVVNYLRLRLRLRLRDWGQLPGLYHQICLERVVVPKVARVDQAADHCVSMDHHCQMARVQRVHRKLNGLPQAEGEDQRFPCRWFPFSPFYPSSPSFLGHDWTCDPYPPSYVSCGSLCQTHF